MKIDCLFACLFTQFIKVLKENLLEIIQNKAHRKNKQQILERKATKKGGDVW